MVLPLIYPNKTGWIGFFIMNKDHRGKGLGRELWSAMERVFHDAGTETIGLDGVEEQVATYTRRGFVDCARIPLMMRESFATKPIDVTWSHEDEVELQDLRDIDPKYLSQLDLDHTGLDRSAYWAADMLPSRAHAFGFAIIQDDKLTGLIYSRRCPGGVRIGPLYAATYSQARQLLHKMMNDHARMEQGEFVAEIFGSNEQGKKVFEELGWRYTGLSYHRMWLHGKVPTEQQEDGLGVKNMYAIFDAGSG
jgi:RimJ/RimL family protein N-acetyltransferase